MAQDFLSEFNIPKATFGKKRKFRIMERTKTVRVPRDLVFYDVETNPTEVEKGIKVHYFKMGIMSHINLNSIGEVKKKTLYTQFKEEDVYNDFMQILKGRNQILIFAHNQNYDFVATNMLFYFTRDNWNVEIFNPDTKAFIIKFVKDNKTVYFLDTLNYFAGSLESLGKELKFHKGNMPRIVSKCEDELKENDYDLEKVSDTTYKYYQKWYKYNLRDVEIMEKAVLNLIDFLVSNDYGSFSYTIASMAYSIFKHSFMNSTLKIHDNIDAISLERASYNGGRSEIFNQGKLQKQNYYVVDFASMYPFVMKDNRFPTSLVGEVLNPSLERITKKSVDYGVIANVDIETEINCIPKKYNDKLIFPIGHFNTTLAQPELDLALSLGIVKNVNKAYLYHMDYVFRDYVDTFFNLKNKNKKSGNGIYAYFYKILLNSLYGKFAQRITEYEKTDLESSLQFASGYLTNEITNQKWYTKTIDYKVYKIIKNIEANHSMPAISSFVTSYARVHLWNHMCIAGHGNYFYCDTDSLFVNQQGYNNLKPYLGKGELGKLEKEGMTRNLEIRTIKDYSFGKKVKRKGVPKSFSEIENNVFLGDKFSRVNDIFVNEDFFDMQTVDFTKRLSGKYEKGNIHTNGKVSPLILTNRIQRGN